MKYIIAILIASTVGFYIGLRHEVVYVEVSAEASRCEKAGGKILTVIDGTEPLDLKCVMASKVIDY